MNLKLPDELFDTVAATTYRCISLWQPWSSLAVLGPKTFETRHWPTKVRGRVLIHAAKRSIDGAGLELMIKSGVASGITALMATSKTHGLPFGAIVGSVEVVSCWECGDGRMVQGGLSRDYPSELERMFGDFTPGRFAWGLEKPIAFPKPVPFKGRQGFFNVPAEVVAGQMREGQSWT